MTPKIIEPSISARSFGCPHCGTLAHQTWFCFYASGHDNNDVLVKVSSELIEAIQCDRKMDENSRAKKLQVCTKLNAGELFLDTERDTHFSRMAYNLHLSQCYSCSKNALWLHDKLLYPSSHLNVKCNSDMPDRIRTDFEEARGIFFLSPRGAAALLRLAVQKLCGELGESGENINDDIACLVKKGLSIQIQQALDIVRVIGNDAVHPGQIDLNDDTATAASLFELLNIIIEEMISEPKRIKEMYDKLPDSKRGAIARRDGTAKPL